MVRESQNASGDWDVIAEDSRNLQRNDDRAPGDDTRVSDPDNYRFVYWVDFLDPAVLARGGAGRERLRIVTTVVTPNHTVETETYHEIGLDIAERRYLFPADPNDPATYQATRVINNISDLKRLSKDVYYNAVDQFMDGSRSGAVVGAWSTQDPMRSEQGLGNELLADGGQEPMRRSAAWTGLFMVDDTGTPTIDPNGDHFIFSILQGGAAELFRGTISEIHADANIVLAAKTGVIDDGDKCEPDADLGCFFKTMSEVEIDKDDLTGAIYDQNTSGELLIFNTENADGQFGLPYIKEGRVDLPFADVYGLDRKQDLAFVANGNGGVQVVDISKISAPYLLGFIKPDGFARDVKIAGRFAFIAASHQGLVVADIADPALPIVATMDTLGVANRISIDGDRLYISNMSGDGEFSGIDVVDISDAYNPRILRSIEFQPQQENLVADGSYEVYVRGGKAYVSVVYSDQEDRPAQALVEIVDLAVEDDNLEDATTPVLTHASADALDFAARDIVIARGGVQVAAGKRGINRIELGELAVLRTAPTLDEYQVRTDIGTLEIEFSGAVDETVNLTDFFRVVADQADMGEDISQQFNFDFGQFEGSPTPRFVEISAQGGFEFDPGRQYFVVVSQGLPAVSGAILGQDYVLRFTTSAAGSALAPDIESVSPGFGGIEGGDRITVRGSNFGDAPQLFLGGQPLVVEAVEAPTAEDPFERIIATTLPNNAGPAAVEVINPSGLADISIGAYVYVDQLHISFVNPAIVKVRQLGENDRVEIAGYGFHEGITLRVYPHGQPEHPMVAEFEVDNDKLTLLSPQKLSWSVAGFGESFRGFADLEIFDAEGNRDIEENALFYGRLIIDRQLESEPPLSFEAIAKLLSEEAIFVPDALKFPPGYIVDIESDENLGYVYVLGRGELAPPTAARSYLTSEIQPGAKKLLKVSLLLTIDGSSASSPRPST